ncbi:hypothetical protein [Mycobacterium sp. URHB0044]|jgi:hypothetical protein|uniref:hypothetical protein n=1 Tax=Mycobacterium sp. URHB0044 TaxID=1380386 RepID=UPI0006888076|nr:hypothetical protein [Mycobacterium sp. URHB0044]
MTSPPPPDQWPSQDAVHGDPDEDTGPIRLVGPSGENVSDAGWPQGYYAPPAADDVVEDPNPGQWPSTRRPPPVEPETFAGRFTAPLTVDPRTVPVRHNVIRVGPIVAGVAGLLAVGLAAWLFWPSSDAAESSSAPSAPSTTERPVDAEAQAKLLRFLPPGYPSNSCEQVDPPNDSLAQVNCQKNADAGGPPSATYTLLRDGAALRAALDVEMRSAAVVTCPGNIQSPGPWRRNATPQQVSGTLVCGLQGGRPTLAWTDDIIGLLGVVRADAKGPTLDQLYAWWSTHS